jgi:integrase
MRGHVRKRGKTWSVIYDEGIDENSKRIQRWKGGFATRKAAQAFLTEILSSLGDGSYVQPSKATLREYLEGEWLPAIAGTVRPLTLTQYQSVVRGRIIPRLGHLRLQALSGGTLNGLYRELEEKGLSPASRRLTHAVLSRALKDAVRWGKLARNPAAAADPPAAPESRATAFTAKELSRFLEHVDGERLFALWRLAATTGMRRGELLGLTWLALDIDGGTLRVDQQLVPTRGGVTGAPVAPRPYRRRARSCAESAAARALVRWRCLRRPRPRLPRRARLADLSPATD